MERSLNPALLGLALGDTPMLPSSQELAELLAQAELDLLLHKSDRLPALEATGWYLHGIASSKEALAVYGIERHRAAFQVSAHIFDLLMNQENLPRISRLKYCFAAQVAYLHSSLDPNAIALSLRVRDINLGDIGVLQNTEELALISAISLLGMAVGTVFDLTDRVRDETRRIESEWQIASMLDTPFGAAANVALAARHVIIFLAYGRAGRLDQARQLLRNALVSEASLQDHNSRWVAAHLLNLIDGLQSSSIWTVLPPSVPPSVRKALVMGKPSIFTLWPPQLQLLSDVEANPLDSKTKRLFLSTPTSGGKTLFAQLLVAAHLASTNTAVCYVAPTRSLCREVKLALDSRLRYIGARVVTDIPEMNWFADISSDKATVEVMTPERLAYLIRSQPERVISDYGLFVFDEVHAVGEAGRGWILEQALSFLHFSTQNSDQRIAIISAAIGNRFHFVQWMEHGGQSVLYRHSDWRGPRRVTGIWRTRADWDDVTVEPRRSVEFPFRLRNPLYGQLDIRIAHSGSIRSLSTTESIGSLARKRNVTGATEKEDNQSTPFYQMLLPLIFHLGRDGSVLIIESTRLMTVKLASIIAEQLPDSELPDIRPILELVVERLGQHHPLIRVLRKGVAYHHGSLPAEIRSSIEDGVTRGHIRFLVATTTLTEGVNLPVRSVIIGSQGSWSATGYNEIVVGPKMVNAIGRAGRATKETEGIVVLAMNDTPRPSDFAKINPSDTDLQITSSLASRDGLIALAAYEAQLATAEDAVVEAASAEVSEFITFVWFVAAELEKLAATLSIEGIREVLEHTLAWVQLDQNNQDRWLYVANHVLSRFSGTNGAARRRWASSGTSIRSASIIENLAKELVQQLQIEEMPGDAVNLIVFLFQDSRLERLLDLREAPRVGIFVHRGGANRDQVDFSLLGMIEEWLLGAEIVELAEGHLSEVGDVDFRFEQLGDLISNVIEVYLPWILGTLIAWTNELLSEHGGTTIIPASLPAYLRWGVASPLALELMSQGVQSRRIASAVAAAWRNSDYGIDPRAWLNSMSVAEWQKQFRASANELRSLLDYTRDRRSGVAIELLRDDVATIEVVSTLNVYPRTEVKLSRIRDFDFSPIGIYDNGVLLGQIPTKQQSDIEAVLGTDFSIRAMFYAELGQAFLSLVLINPEE